MQAGVFFCFGYRVPGWPDICNVEQGDLELGMIFVSLPLEIWDSRHTPLGLVLPDILAGTTKQHWYFHSGSSKPSAGWKASVES